MRLQDLEHGMEITLRNGEKYTVNYFDEKNRRLTTVSKEVFGEMQEDLTNSMFDYYDIMTVKDTHGNILFARDSLVTFGGITVGTEWKCTNSNFAKYKLGGQAKSMQVGETVKILSHFDYVGSVTVLDLSNRDLFIPIEQLKAFFVEVKEEKFYFYPKGMQFDSKNVMNYHNYDHLWYVDSTLNNDRYKTQFTVKEFKELGLDPHHYDSIPVSEVV